VLSKILVVTKADDDEDYGECNGDELTVVVVAAVWPIGQWSQGTPRNRVCVSGLDLMCWLLSWQ